MSRRNLSAYFLRKKMMLAFFAIIGIFLVGWSYASAQVNQSEEDAVKQVCTQALVADQTLAIPLQSVHQTTTSSESTIAYVPTTAEIQQMNTHISQVYGSLYNGALALKKSTAVKNALVRFQNENIAYLGGGVQSIRFQAITVSGNSAIVTYHASVWAEMVQIHPNGTKSSIARPVGGITNTLTLTKVKGVWIIESQHGVVDPTI